MLEVNALQAWYGKSHILRGVTLQVGAGEMVALLGRNGAGRSTTLKALMGELQTAGSVLFQGRQLLGRPSHEIARLGIGCVPEHRDIFPGLTVRENLLLGCKPGPAGTTRPPWSVDAVLQRFPLLAARADVPGGVLSGGEQQLLSLCRSLMGNPALLLVDEPTEGLAPHLVDDVARLLQECAAQGMAVLLVEQKLSIALRLAGRVYVMGRGRIVFEGAPAALLADTAVRREWLEV